VPVWIEVTVSVVVAPVLSVSVVVTVTVVVVNPVCPLLLAVRVYHPLGPTPPHELPPHPTGPPQGPKPVHDEEAVLQLEYSEHNDDRKLEIVANSELGHAEETQLATGAVLVQWEAQAEVYVEKAEDKQD